MNVGRDRVVGRATRSGDRIPVGARFSAPVQTGPGAHPASYSMGTVHSWEVKRLGRGVDPPPHLVLRLKKEKCYTSNPTLGHLGLFQGEPFNEWVALAAFYWAKPWFTSPFGHRISWLRISRFPSVPQCHLKSSNYRDVGVQCSVGACLTWSWCLLSLLSTMFLPLEHTDSGVKRTNHLHLYSRLR